MDFRSDSDSTFRAESAWGIWTCSLAKMFCQEILKVSKIKRFFGLHAVSWKSDPWDPDRKTTSLPPAGKSPFFPCGADLKEPWTWIAGGLLTVQCGKSSQWILHGRYIPHRVRFMTHFVLFTATLLSCYVHILHSYQSAGIIRITLPHNRLFSQVGRYLKDKNCIPKINSAIGIRWHFPACDLVVQGYTIQITGIASC